MKKHRDETIPHVPFSQPGFYPVTIDVYDPLGSYTGYPADPTEKPIQDADDL